MVGVCVFWGGVAGGFFYTIWRSLCAPIHLPEMLGLQLPDHYVKAKAL